MKYSHKIYIAIKDYFNENLNQDLSIEEIDKNLTKYEVLDYFLKWEGIMGYTDAIYSIFEEK